MFKYSRTVVCNTYIQLYSSREERPLAVIKNTGTGKQNYKHNFKDFN